MVKPPLSANQQRELKALVTAHRLTTVPVDLQRAERFLELAANTLDDVDHVRQPQTRFNLAYDAVHAVGESLLAPYGFRTTTSPGQHEALARFLRVVLDQPPADSAARQVDRMRRTRNQMHYEARPVGAADAAQAVRVARELYAAAHESTHHH